MSKDVNNKLYQLSDNELLNIFIEEKNLLNENETLNKLNIEDNISTFEEPMTQYKIMAMKEIAKRLIEPQKNKPVSIDKPIDLINWLNLEIGYEKQEHFIAVYLDKQNSILTIKKIFKGTLDRSVVHPREIFKEAVKASASSIILVHNHPSGSLSASHSDIRTTEILAEAGNLLGIFILDHLIVSNGSYTSIRETHPNLFSLI